MKATAAACPRWRRLLDVACLAAALLTSRADLASAAAWNRPAGTGLVIFDFTRGAGTDYFDGGGKLAPARAYAKDELAAYVEYGLTDDVTLIARPALDRTDVGGPDGGGYRGLGRSGFGAQWQALVFGPAVLAVQGSFTLPGSTSARNPAVTGDTERDADLRFLAGFSMPSSFKPFIDVEGSYRFRSGGAASEWHGDLTVGFYPTDKLLLLAQSFSRIPTGPGDVVNRSSRSTDVGFKAVYALSPVWAVQLGVFTTASGRNALRERGFSTGIWHFF